MSPDSLVANPGRLRILTALAVEPRQPFVVLRKQTGLTDGNLASHAKRLEAGGLVQVQKSFEAGKPVTTFILTGEGRGALEAHARRVLAALSHRRITTAVESQSAPAIAMPTAQAA